MKGAAWASVMDLGLREPLAEMKDQGSFTRGTKMSLKTRHEVPQRATSGEHEKKPRWIAMPRLPEVQGPVIRPVTLGVTHTSCRGRQGSPVPTVQQTVPGTSCETGCGDPRCISVALALLSLLSMPCCLFPHPPLPTRKSCACARHRVSCLSTGLIRGRFQETDGSGRSIYIVDRR